MKLKIAFVALAAVMSVAIASPAQAGGHRHHHRHAAVHVHHGKKVVKHRRATRPAAKQEKSIFSIFDANGNGAGLISTAKRYLGTNPTGRSSLWCGAFLDLVLRKNGYEGGGNLAMGYRHYGKPAGGPHRGAIAVMPRRGGGHVGIVLGKCDDGKIRIISGNHRKTVGEGCYDPGRIVAYREPARGG